MNVNTKGKLLALFFAMALILALVPIGETGAFDVEPLKASLGDYVWHDENQDGIQDPEEAGIEGVVVKLLDCDSENVLATTSTNEDGYYLFEDLAAGSYRVKFVLPEGNWTFSPQDTDVEGIEGEFNSDADPDTGLTACVTLEAGDNRLFVDAGMYLLPEPPIEYCYGDETAWAYGGEHAKPNWNYVNAKNWGWTNGPLAVGHYEFDIYAGAGQNNLQRGVKVGILAVDINDDSVTVTYKMGTVPGYGQVYLDEVHLWVGADVLPQVKRGRNTVYTNAPGQFPNSGSFSFDSSNPAEGVTEWQYTTSDLNGNGIYVAAHAVVWIPGDCE